MMIKIKNWLIKLAVKGLIKSGKSKEALSIFKEIVADLEVQIKTKK